MNKLTPITLLLLTAPFAVAQAPVLFEGPLGAIPENPEVVVREGTMAPGRRAALPHRHDAYVYLYVIEGAMELQLEGGEVKRYSAGEVFSEKPDDVHVMTANPSDTEPTRYLIVTIKSEGAPFAVAVDRENH